MMLPCRQWARIPHLAARASRGPPGACRSSVQILSWPAWCSVTRIKETSLISYPLAFTTGKYICVTLSAWVCYPLYWRSTVTLKMRSRSEKLIQIRYQMKIIPLFSSLSQGQHSVFLIVPVLAIVYLCWVIKGFNDTYPGSTSTSSLSLIIIHHFQTQN